MDLGGLLLHQLSILTSSINYYIKKYKICVKEEQVPYATLYMANLTPKWANYIVQHLNGEAFDKLGHCKQDIEAKATN